MYLVRKTSKPKGCHTLPKRARRVAKRSPCSALVVATCDGQPCRARPPRTQHKSVDVVPRRRPQARSDETMADAASQKLAHDLARAEARKTLWETELAGLAARREDDAAAAAAAVKESVLAREAADPLMTVHGDADANPYARPARGGGGCAVM